MYNHDVGMWRSLVAHLTGGQGVAGSNPVIPTTSSFWGCTRVSPRKSLNTSSSLRRSRQRRTQNRNGMRGYYVALLLMLSVDCASAQSLSPAERQQNPTAQERQDKTDEQLRAIAAELRALREQQANAEQTRPQDETRYRETAFWPPVWSNWLLAFFAAGAAVIALKTLRAIEEQVVANVDAAHAAKESAEVATRMLKMNRPSLQSRDWRFTADGPWLWASFDASNASNVLTRITDVRLHATVSAPPIGGDPRTGDPVARPTHDYPDTALVTPGGSHPISFALGRVDLPNTESERLRYGFENAALSVIVDGTITYADMFNIYTLKTKCLAVQWGRSQQAKIRKTDDEDLTDKSQRPE